jgi:hypothetical protein
LSEADYLSLFEPDTRNEWIYLELKDDDETTTFDLSEFGVLRSANRDGIVLINDFAIQRVYFWRVPKGIDPVNCPEDDPQLMMNTDVLSQAGVKPVMLRLVS